MIRGEDGAEGVWLPVGVFDGTVGETLGVASDDAVIDIVGVNDAVAPELVV